MTLGNLLTLSELQFVHACMHTQSLQSRLTLYDPMDRSPPGSSVHGILQARILKWVTMLSSGDLPDPGIEHTSLISSALAGRFCTASATWEARASAPSYAKQKS